MKLMICTVLTLVAINAILIVAEIRGLKDCQRPVHQTMADHAQIMAVQGALGAKFAEGMAAGREQAKQEQAYIECKRK